MNMSINKFAQIVMDKVQKELGEGYEVTLRTIPKNNGVTLTGLIIAADGQNVSPTIYMDSFKHAYDAGMPISNIVKGVLEIYGKDTPRENVDMEFFKDFEKVKGRICYRLINREQNEELLTRIPHMEFLDLAVCFYYAYQGRELGEGSILIFNNHMEMWGTSVDALYELAKQNTPVLFPWECENMKDVLCAYMQEGDDSMKILGNRSHTYGAAVILYSGLLEEIARKNNRNFYILPSSIHEVILLEEKENGNGDVEMLKAMIADVNDTQVEREEILSYNLYYFDLADNNIRIF